MKKSLIFPAVFLVLTQIFAAILAPRFLNMGFYAFEDPSHSGNALFLFLVFPVVLIMVMILVRRNLKRVLNTLFFISIFIAMAVTLYVTFAGILGELISIPVAVILTLSITLILRRGKWYFTDGAGLVLAAGITAMLGISLEPLLMGGLLAALSLYDFLSVHVTKHMVTMADSISDLNLPMMLLFPEDPRDFKFEGIMQQGEEQKKDEPSGIFLGLGDIVIPSSYVISLYIFLSPGVALFAAAGTILGIIVLLIATYRRGINAGLPFMGSFGIALSVVGYFLVM